MKRAWSLFSVEANPQVPAADAGNEALASIEGIEHLLQNVWENHPLLTLMESLRALDPDGSYALEVAIGLTEQ
jgi:hypothetical protein